MKHYAFLWAIGPDRFGIVSALTRLLYKHHCNLEDSSMMRLGSEFGVFVSLRLKAAFLPL